MERTYILRADVVLSFSGVTLVLFCFVFVFFLSLKPRPFVQSFFVFRYACAPTATRSCLTKSASFFVFVSSFFFLSLEMSLFPSIFVSSLHHRFLLLVWRLRRTPKKKKKKGRRQLLGINCVWLSGRMHIAERRTIERRAATSVKARSRKTKTKQKQNKSNTREGRYGICKPNARRIQVRTTTSCCVYYNKFKLADFLTKAHQVKYP